MSGKSLKLAILIYGLQGLDIGGEGFMQEHVEQVRAGGQGGLQLITEGHQVSTLTAMRRCSAEVGKV